MAAENKLSDPALTTKESSWAGLGSFGRGIAGVLVVIILWEIICRAFQVPEFILPAPIAIIGRVFAEWQLLAAHAWVTLSEMMLGFALAVIIGVLAAILVTTSDRVKDVAMPLIVITQLIPKIAIAPVILIWFGYGISSKVVIAFLIAVFPIVIDMATGLTMIERELIELLRSLGASRWKIFVKAQIPNSLPHLFSGMRVSITLAMIGAVVGEFVGGSEGLGYIIVVGTSELKTALVFAAIFVLTAVGFLLFALIGWVERLVIPWSASERDELMKITGM